MKNKNIKGILALVFLMPTLSLSAQRQHTVTGKVVDADSGSPLAGVAVLNSISGGGNDRLQRELRNFGGR